MSALHPCVETGFSPLGNHSSTCWPVGMEAGERPAPPWRAGTALMQASPSWLISGQQLQPVGMPHAGAGKQQADPAGRSGLGLWVSWDSAVAFFQELQRSLSSDGATAQQPHPWPHVWCIWRGSSVPYRLLVGRDLDHLCVLSRGRSHRLSVLSAAL